MKNSTPKQVALIVALLLSGFTFILVALATYLFAHTSWLAAVFSSLAVGLCSYFVVLLYIRRFILSRIHVIYRTISDFKFGSGNDPVQHLGQSEDLLMKVQRDVTDWARGQASEIENLKKLENYRREFLANVSHELKTPIFNIQGYVMTLLDGGLEDETINRNYLQRAEKSVERMINIIDDLEAISRLESGELSLDKSVFDIAELARDLFESQDLKAAKKRIKLRFREESKRPVRVNADKNLIRQVLTNLIVNSIKYGREDGETEIRFNDMDESLLVEVADNGIGIMKDHLPRLFERFYRVDKGRSREEGGTGLGLAIVKHIIEAHGHTINVRSTEGVGSTFSFTLTKA